MAVFIIESSGHVNPDGESIPLPGGFRPHPRSICHRPLRPTTPVATSRSFSLARATRAAFLSPIFNPDQFEDALALTIHGFLTQLDDRAPIVEPHQKASFFHGFFKNSAPHRLILVISSGGCTRSIRY
jgi:hypothetical protein